MQKSVEDHHLLLRRRRPHHHHHRHHHHHHQNHQHPQPISMNQQPVRFHCFLVETGTEDTSPQEITNAPKNAMITPPQDKTSAGSGLRHTRHTFVKSKSHSPRISYGRCSSRFYPCDAHMLAKTNKNYTYNIYTYIYIMYVYNMERERERVL